jgi:ABC-2 type transport system ATP-binding protein
MGSPDELKAAARSSELPDPTLEDAFVSIVQADDREAAA